MLGIFGTFSSNSSACGFPLSFPMSFVQAGAAFPGMSPPDGSLAQGSCREEKFITPGVITPLSPLVHSPSTPTASALGIHEAKRVQNRGKQSFTDRRAVPEPRPKSGWDFGVCEQGQGLARMIPVDPFPSGYFVIPAFVRGLHLCTAAAAHPSRDCAAHRGFPALRGAALRVWGFLHPRSSS